MSRHWTIYPPVASPEAAAYDRQDHSDCGPDKEEPAEIVVGMRVVKRYSGPAAPGYEPPRGRVVSLHFVSGGYWRALVEWDEDVPWCGGHRGMVNISTLEPLDLEPAEWEEDPALLAALDAEMQEQAEEWALLVAQMTAPAGGGSEEEEPW